MADIDWLFKNGARILEKASKALQYPLCDHCLGRLFARSGYGLNNQERGKAIRIMLALSAELLPDGENASHNSVSIKIPIHPLKVDIGQGNAVAVEEDGWHHAGTPSMSSMLQGSAEEGQCWLCHDIFDSVDELAMLVSKVSKGLEFGTYLIGTRIDPGTADREKTIWEIVDPSSAEPLKEELNREIGKVFSELEPSKDFNRSEPDITFIIDPLFKTVELSVKPIFIRGRYLKLVRGIPQTRWICTRCRGRGCEKCNGKGKMYETSVEELIGYVIVEKAGGSNYKLHGMGREDVDVLALGTGRPFILEISEPTIRDLDLPRLMEKVNESAGEKVKVMDLTLATRKDIPSVKEGTSLKRYQAVISFQSPLDEETLKYNISLLAQSPISQRTPKRVSHRRSDKVRVRKVHEAYVLSFDGDRAKVEFLTDGGLYIKELLHGDEGRTEPSLSSLLGLEVTVDNLDVTGVMDNNEDPQDQG
jgi:tRNA pseudouridine synthase 10